MICTQKETTEPFHFGASEFENAVAIYIPVIIIPII